MWGGYSRRMLCRLCMGHARGVAADNDAGSDNGWTPSEMPRLQRKHCDVPVEVLSGFICQIQRAGQH